jgi:tRNA-splicing endonuclease subunit Sen34
MKPTPPPKLQSTDLEWFQVIPAQTPKSDKFLIFKHLYDQGFYITNGSKFGGDYLVYQNDPEHCHSFYIVSIVKGRISMLDLVAHARLGKQTNKMKVFCYWDEGFHSIAMDWTGWV